MFNTAQVPASGSRVWEKFKSLWRSRKFWVLLTALVMVWSTFALGEVNIWQALQGSIAALCVYSTGVAIEDAGYWSGQNK